MHVMDEGLARGVCRQHLRTAVPSGDERSSRLSSLVIGLSEKLSSGRALTNPTAAMPQSNMNQSPESRPQSRPTVIRDMYASPD